MALLVRADGGTTTCGGVATYTRGDRALSAETKKIENSRIDFLRAQEDHDGARCRCTVGKEGRRRIYSYSMIL